MKTILALFLTLLFTSNLYAQIESQPVKDAEVWYVVNFEVNGENIGPFINLFKDHFLPAAKEAGVNVMFFEHASGRYAASMHVHLDGGFAELDMEPFPSMAKLATALMDKAGVEEGNKVYASMGSMIESRDIEYRVRRTW